MTTERGTTFASLAVRNYNLYFWGQSISVAGTWIQNVALDWLVLVISHSGTQLGIVTGARFLPILVLGPWGGLLADRMDKRRLLFATQFVAGAISAVLAIVVVLELDSLLVVDLLALALGMVNVLASPVRQTFVNDMVPPELLSNAVALNSISVNVGRVVGPLFSGAFIAAIGVAGCFAINAVSFVAVLVSLAAMRVRDLYPVDRVVRQPGQLRDGLRYVIHTPDVFLPMAMITVIGTFAWEFQVTLPLVATASFGGGAWTYGAMLAALGAGSAAAGLWVARIRESTMRTVAMSATWLGVALAAAAAAPNLYVEVVVLVVAGWSTISFSVRAKSALQLRSMPVMRGRVMAIWAVAWQGTSPIGGPFVGWLGQAFGARWSLVGGAVPTLAIGVIALVVIRRLPPAASNAASNATSAAQAVTPAVRPALSRRSDPVAPGGDHL